MDLQVIANEAFAVLEWAARSRRALPVGLISASRTLIGSLLGIGRRVNRESELRHEF